MAALEAVMGAEVVVRSDDVEGNEVSGVAAPTTDEAQERRFRALFSDDGVVRKVDVD